MMVIISIPFDIDNHHPDHLSMDDPYLDHLGMDDHHPDHLGVLLRDGVKDMGDLAERDSQSIRPIHPNLLSPPDDHHADDEDEVSDHEDGDDEAPLCESIGPNLLFCLWARMLSIPFVQGGNNTIQETVEIHLRKYNRGNNTNRKQCRAGTAPIEGSTIWRRRVLITGT